MWAMLAHPEQDLPIVTSTLIIPVYIYTLTVPCTFTSPLTVPCTSTSTQYLYIYKHTYTTYTSTRPLTILVHLSFVVVS